MMLTGKTLDARRAKAIGLVDAVTQERHVRNAVLDAVAGKLKQRKPGLLDGVMQHRPGAAVCSPTACAREAQEAGDCRSTIPRPMR